MKIILSDVFMEILILLSYLNKSQVYTYESSGLLKSDQKHRTQKAAQKANELLCYMCQTMDVTQTYCLNVNDSNTEIQQKCKEDSRICMVKKVSFQSFGENNTTATHKTFSLERSCTNRCEPGCIAIGERLKLRKCVTCCQDNLCNSGNSSPIFALPTVFKPVIIFSHLFINF